MPVYSVPAPSETSSVDRKPLPGNEDYRAEVLEITESIKPDFNGVPTPVLTVKLGIKSFADGAPLEDIEGNPIEGDRWIWRDLDPKRMGFKQDGTASLTRQFLLAANGINDLTASLPPADTDELIGREVVLSLIVYVGQKDGTRRNRIVAFKPLSRRRGQPVAQTTKKKTDEPSDEYTRAVASLLSGEPEPSEQDIAEVESMFTGEK